MICRGPKKMHMAKSLFAECQNKVTRQNTSLPSARKKHSAKTYFAVCFCLPSVFYLALGKHGLCRVPDKIHSAKARHSANRRFSVVMHLLHGHVRTYVRYYVVYDMRFVVLASASATASSSLTDRRLLLAPAWSFWCLRCTHGRGRPAGTGSYSYPYQQCIYVAVITYGGSVLDIYVYISVASYNTWAS